MLAAASGYLSSLWSAAAERSCLLPIVTSRQRRLRFAITMNGRTYELESPYDRDSKVKKKITTEKKKEEYEAEKTLSFEKEISKKKGQDCR